MTAPVLTRPAHYLEPFAAELARRLHVDPVDVAGALVDLVLAGLIEVYADERGIVLLANPLHEETDAKAEPKAPDLHVPSR